MKKKKRTAGDGYRGRAKGRESGWRRVLFWQSATRRRRELRQVLKWGTTALFFPLLQTLLSSHSSDSECLSTAAPHDPADEFISEHWSSLFRSLARPRPAPAPGR